MSRHIHFGVSRNMERPWKDIAACFRRFQFPLLGLCGEHLSFVAFLFVALHCISFLHDVLHVYRWSAVSRCSQKVVLVVRYLFCSYTDIIPLFLSWSATHMWYSNSNGVDVHAHCFRLPQEANKEWRIILTAKLYAQQRTFLCFVTRCHQRSIEANSPAKTEPRDDQHEASPTSKSPFLRASGRLPQATSDSSIQVHFPSWARKR